MSAERSEGAPRSSLLRQEAGFVQKGFGLRSAVAGSLEADYRGYAVEALRALGNSFDAGPITVHLAKEFGFCYGVDRAIDYAYETREHFPDRTIYVTNEIIHNPFVNRRLREQGIRFFEDGYGPDDIAADDVVLLPAFGASVELVEQLKTRLCLAAAQTAPGVAGRHIRPSHLTPHRRLQGSYGLVIVSPALMDIGETSERLLVRWVTSKDLGQAALRQIQIPPLQEGHGGSDPDRAAPRGQLESLLDVAHPHDLIVSEGHGIAQMRPRHRIRWV